MLLSKTLRNKKFNNSIFQNVFLNVPQEKSKKLLSRIKKKKGLNLVEIKFLCQNLLFITFVGWSKWAINNCIIIDKILLNC